MSTLRAYLRGVGLWTPAYESFERWCAAGMPDELSGAPEPAGAALPTAALLHPRLRRRTSVFTRATVTALEAAAARGGAALDDVRLVLVSSFGEIETTVELLAQLAEPQGPVSPTKFHNSVHNTATGYMSIASGNHRESTALAGGPHNLEIALLELLAGLSIDGGDAVLLVAEELLPSPFARPDADPTFAMALHFGVEPGGLGIAAALEAVPVDAAEQPASGGIPSMLAPTLALLRSVARLSSDPATPQTVNLSEREDPAVDLRWSLTLARGS
jgi:hypothetical protein